MGNVSNSWNNKEKERKFIIDSMIMKVLFMRQTTSCKSK
jgi:hypothetical protein